MTALLVFLGAGVGGVLRYGVSRWMMSSSGVFPWGTLAVNVSGSFLITFLIGWAHTRGLSVERQTFIAAGFCGGYTTFSAFSVETLRFIEAGQWQRATVYVVASVSLSVLGALAGLRLAPGHA
jgi:fluoride exporter